eukprot:Lithocolla_globosa_v1_NODE_3_length_14236_cov_22.745998.p16 type:complete len:118 gc:universal NODE_3_length_14236_cov_22.745998:2614-2261(-)
MCFASRENGGNTNVFLAHSGWILARKIHNATDLAESGPVCVNNFTHVVADDVWAIDGRFDAFFIVTVDLQQCVKLFFNLIFVRYQKIIGFPRRFDSSNKASVCCLVCCIKWQPINFF